MKNIIKSLERRDDVNLLRTRRSFNWIGFILSKLRFLSRKTIFLLHSEMQYLFVYFVKHDSFVFSGRDVYFISNLGHILRTSGPG